MRRHDEGARRGAGAERGQATVLVVAVVAVAGLVAIGTVRLGVATAARARAQAAADASALAGALDGRADADRLAAANGATITDYREAGADVVVTVRRDGFEATARARRTRDGPARR